MIIEENNMGNMDAMQGEMDSLKKWLIERRRRLQEKKEHQLLIKPKDIQSARVAGIKARALQEVINHIEATQQKIEVLKGGK